MRRSSGLGALAPALAMLLAVLANPSPAAPAAPMRNAWRQARDLADRGQPDSALALLRPAIARDPRAFDLRWLEAGLTGEAGRTAEAVRLYERLSAEFPDRAGDLLGDLAKERLRADDPRGAARDLRAWLATHPEDAAAKRRLALALARSDSLSAALAAYDALLAEQPGDTESALDRARVLGWMGRHRQAIAAYAALLDREPELASARLGIARNLNDLGRHRSATRRLESFVARDAADAEAWKALAFARYWDDDPDGALRALATHRALVPEDREATALAERIARENRTTLELGYGRSNDSDGQNVSSPAVELSWPLARNTAGNVGWRHDVTEDAGGTSNVMQLSAGVRRRLSAAWTVYARGTSVTWDDRVGAPRGGEAGVIARPMDHVRLEAVAVREPVLTRLALERGISLLAWVGTADFDVTSRVAFHADARAARFSDGNRSERSAASARWQTVDGRRWDVTALLGVEQLNVHQDLDHGYYDPDFHREWGPGAEIEWRPEPRWSLRAIGRTGWQRDKGGAADPYYGASGRIRWAPDQDWSLTAEGGRGDSNLLSTGGYRRAWWRLSVVRAF